MTFESSPMMPSSYSSSLSTQQSSSRNPLLHTPSRRLTSSPFAPSSNRSGNVNLLRQRPNRPIVCRLTKLLACGRSSITTTNNNNNGHNNTGGRGGGDGGDGDGDGDDGGTPDRNRRDALILLSASRKKLESLPADLAAAVKGGRITSETMQRFLQIEGLPLIRWLMQFRGFTERLLADDLFLTKLAVECGVGIIAKNANEYENARENSFKEIKTVTTDKVKSILVDFALVYVSAPTVSLQPPFATNAGLGASLSHNFPAAASHIAFVISSYLLLHRLQAIARIFVKLSGTSPSLVSTVATDAPVIAMKTVVKELDDKVKETWWSHIEAGAEVVNQSSMRGGRLHPITMAKVSASLSRGSSGRS